MLRVPSTYLVTNRKGVKQKFEFVNFKGYKFSFLNITALVKSVVEDSLSFVFSCLENLACFLFLDKAGKFACEILSMDECSNSENFLLSKTFHHFNIVVSILSLNFVLALGWARMLNQR